jgi:hypothetical protein
MVRQAKQDGAHLTLAPGGSLRLIGPGADRWRSTVAQYREALIEALLEAAAIPAPVARQCGHLGCQRFTLHARCDRHRAAAGAIEVSKIEVSGDAISQRRQA